MFDNLFYADVAIGSCRTFRALKDEGKIAPGTKFQVDLVPAHSVIWLFVEEDLHAAIDPIYNAAVKREIDKLAAAIPHDQLAIQLDVASAVFARLERGDVSSYGAHQSGDVRDAFSRILLDLGNHVPADIELLYHFCYGDAGHRHVVEPTDMGDMVELANRLSAGATRDIELIHMPVPRDRSDEAYFEPLRQLKLRPETELCLGLVHYTDGIAGTRKRIAAAEKFVRDFSIGTECGFGRRDPATIPELLRIHAASRQPDLVIRPLRPDERAAWEPLWQDYLTFYESRVSPETTDVLWQRLHDPNEPMFVLGAYSPDGVRERLIGIVHYLFHQLLLDHRRLLLSAGLVCRPRRARGLGAGRALIEAVEQAARLTAQAACTG